MKLSAVTQGKLVEALGASLTHDKDRWEIEPDQCAWARVPGKRVLRKWYQLKSTVMLTLVSDVRVEVSQGCTTVRTTLDKQYSDQLLSMVKALYQKRTEEFHQQQLMEDAKLRQMLDLE